jgi:hypothetical protein
MGWLLTTVLLLLSPASSDPERLPARDLALPLVVVQAVEPLNFDLIDVRDVARLEALKARPDDDPHSIFVVKRHLGASAGYDNTIAHGSVGLYLTVAEWGRWNFGVPTIGVGAGRYRLYDRSLGQTLTKDQVTVFVSIASVHYRVSYLPSLGVTWYLNFEQVYDLRYSMPGSQFGVSFSSK